MGMRDMFTKESRRMNAIDMGKIESLWDEMQFRAILGLFEFEFPVSCAGARLSDFDPVFPRPSWAKTPRELSMPIAAIASKTRTPGVLQWWPGPSDIVKEGDVGYMIQSWPGTSAGTVEQ